MARQTGVARRMFRALADAGINILMITTSEIKISVLVAASRPRWPCDLHHAFRTGSRAAGAATATAGHATARSGDAPLAVVRRLQKMEDLTIDEISLDQSQARLTIDGVRRSSRASRPGCSTRVADAGVFVDMIVQSFGARRSAAT